MTNKRTMEMNFRRKWKTLMVKMWESVSLILKNVNLSTKREDE